MQPRIPPPEPRDASPSAYTLWKLARLASTDTRGLDHPPTPIRPSSSPDPPDAHHHQYIPPGAYRPLTFRNVGLAITILQQSTFALFTMLWTNIHPVRIVLFLLLNFIRGLFPAVRSFSQSLLLDQVRASHGIKFTSECVDLCSIPLSTLGPFGSQRSSRLISLSMVACFGSWSDARRSCL